MREIKPFLETLPVTGLCLDSRKVQPGEVFFAFPGEKGDGRQYIQQAIDRGAVGVICEEDFSLRQQAGHFQVPIFFVNHLREKISEIASEFYRHRSEER